MLTLPTHNGFMVEWETGEFIKSKPKHNSFTTTSKEKAEQIADERKKSGYKNVKIYECIY